MATASSTLTRAAAVAALGLQTATAFLVVPPPSTSIPAALVLARRPSMGCARVSGWEDGGGWMDGYSIIGYWIEVQDGLVG